MKAARRKPIIISTIAAAIIAIALCYRIFTGDVTFSYIEPDTNSYTVKGIDVSAHNGDIDFHTIANEGYRFVYIKASEGRTFRDKRFADNHRKAVAAGLAVGAYHFFRFDVPGEEQAHNLMDAINGKALHLPLAIDVETQSNASFYSSAAITRELRNMVDELSVYGYPLIIYTNKRGNNSFINNDFGDCDLWICSFVAPDKVRGWTFWQYSHSGEVKGVTGDVDLDVWNGKADNWDNEIRKNKSKFSTAEWLRSAINADNSR